MLHKCGLSILLLAFTASFAAGQTTSAPRDSSPPVATAAASATAPAAGVPADFSSPLKAAKSYVRASFGDRAAAMRDALLVPTAHAADVDAFLSSIEASRVLQAAAKSRFGAVGVTAFASAGPSLEDQLNNLDAATVDVKGDTATLTLSAAAAGGADEPKGIVLKKSGDQWQIDAVSLFTLDAPADKLAARVTLAKKVAAIAQDTAKDILANRFPSATNAYQDFWARCQAVATAATVPATSTAPAAEVGK